MDLIKGFVISVAVEGVLYFFDDLFDYSVSDEMINDVLVGKRVIVPFGKGNRNRVGVIFAAGKKEYDPMKIKQIKCIIDDGIFFSEELIQLMQWIRNTTFCTYFDAVRTVLPTGLSLNISQIFALNPEADAEINEEESLLFDLLKKVKTQKQLNMMLNDDSSKDKQRLIKSLISKGYIVADDTIRHRTGAAEDVILQLCDDFEEHEKYAKLTPKQKNIVNSLNEIGTASMRELKYVCSVSSGIINTLVKYGLIIKNKVEVSRAISIDAVATENIDDITLSPEQTTVFGGLKKLMESGEPQCALLKGVTGSGKTTVFVKLIDAAIKAGKSAIMLVPEISLTPQMVQKFQSLFGNKVAIIHSHLSIGERTDEYKRIASGAASIVIGTRSAIFAPLKNIGVIVIDEEGEHTYKSEKSPRYHAREVAKQRSFKNNALLLLASATPSLESYYNCKRGKYTLFNMNTRYNQCNLPEVFIVDMKLEAVNGNRSNFSEPLINELRTNLEKGEQSLLLLNRRGYNTFANCIKCGAVVECPNCNIPLTYHKQNDTASCHYCGYTQKFPEQCAKCGSKYIYTSGTGTQRIEDEIKAYFPQARILRMDADTTMSKNSYEQNFKAFGNHEYDIMIGTQMIAKGLDFENVTLVGILLIDKSLYAGDYMGYERTFSLITQVVGRSGRGGKKGRAYLQTFTPDHYILELSASQNYEEFYEQEIELRKTLLFPPFCDICLVGFVSLMEQQCQKAAQRFIELFSERIKHEEKIPPFRLLGPSKIGTGKMAGKYRYKLIFKCIFNKQFIKIINDIIKIAYKDKQFMNTSFYIDVNGDVN